MFTHIKQRYSQASDQLSRQTGLVRCEAIVASLAIGLTNLRNLLIKRIHADVEDYYGVDSMLAPINGGEEERELHNAKLEAELYSLVVAADETRRVLGETDEKWLVDWFLRLRLGQDVPKSVERRLADYLKRSLARRRLLFSNILIRVVPEANKAPLILFRLYPKAVRLAVAVAFNDPLRAAELRSEQIALLPAIEDCLQCHGRPLDTEEICEECGNPLWKLPWLLDADL